MKCSNTNCHRIAESHCGGYCSICYMAYRRGWRAAQLDVLTRTNPKDIDFMDSQVNSK